MKLETDSIRVTYRPNNEHVIVEPDTLFEPIYTGSSVILLEGTIKTDLPIEQFDRNFLIDMAGMIGSIDQAYEKHLTSDRADVKPRIFSTKYSEEEVREHQANYLQGAQNILNGLGERGVTASPMSGSMAMLALLAGAKYPVYMSSSAESGLESGDVHIRRDVADELLDPEKIVLWSDDIGDTLLTAAEFTFKRYLFRVKRSGGNANQEYEAMMRELHDLQKEKASFSDSRYAKWYPILAKFFHDEGVIVSALYNKNDPAIQTIRKHAENILDDGYTDRRRLIAKSQEQAISLMKPVEQSEWVVGSKGDWDYPVLDTPVSGQLVLESMPDDEEHRWIKEKLKELNFQTLTFRLGAQINRLAIFNPDKAEHAFYGGFLELVKDYILQYIRLKYTKPSDNTILFQGL